MNDVTTVVPDSAMTDPGILPVVLMGVGIVFLGIVLIVIICRLMLAIGSIGAKYKKEEEKTALPVTAEFKPDAELAAVIGAAVAEEAGVDVKNIKIVSIKKVGV